MSAMTVTDPSQLTFIIIAALFAMLLVGLLMAVAIVRLIVWLSEPRKPQSAKPPSPPIR